jgi:hypothetical protein
MPSEAVQQLLERGERSGLFSTADPQVPLRQVLFQRCCCFLFRIIVSHGAVIA